MKAKTISTRYLLRILALFLFCQGIGPTPARAGAQDLIENLQSEDSRTRFAAATSLGALCFARDNEAKQALPDLVRVLSSDQDSGVRIAAATALGRCNATSKEASAALSGALSDPDQRVREAASKALIGIRGGIGPGITVAPDALSSFRRATPHHHRHQRAGE